MNEEGEDTQKRNWGTVYLSNTENFEYVSDGEITSYAWIKKSYSGASAKSQTDKALPTRPLER